MTKEYGCDIIISEFTYNLCSDRLWVRQLDKIRVRDFQLKKYPKFLVVRAEKSPNNTGTGKMPIPQNWIA